MLIVKCSNCGLKRLHDWKLYYILLQLNSVIVNRATRALFLKMLHINVKDTVSEMYRRVVMHMHLIIVWALTLIHCVSIAVAFLLITE